MGGKPTLAGGFRSDIQALRAIAVLAVVFNHLWPARITGGYVGVDVFFVISGFLISAHLNREISRTGRVRLTRFYARRIRRLLPAAFLVLLFSLTAAYFLLPLSRWKSTALEVLASAFYGENWWLAAHSVDYSALTSTASLAQHYWSLSVEEQFYLCWPLLLLFLSKVRLPTARIIGIAVIGLASLAFSIYFTAASKSQAYFYTPVRVWEFAVGALIALLGTKVALPKVVSGLASFAGFIMIFGSVFLFDDQTRFPGWIALVPAAGTALIIAAGVNPGPSWHTVITSSPPIQFVGNISYSLYLWHWPLIVLAPFALGSVLPEGRLTFPFRVTLVILALAFAYLSKILIEDRRDWAPLAKSAKNTFLAMVAGMAAITMLVNGLLGEYNRRIEQNEAATRNTTIQSCHGAAATAVGNDCADPYGPAKVIDMGPANAPWAISPVCGEPLNLLLAGDTKTTRVCDFGAGASSAVVWLVGDSHAEQWQTPLLDLARQHRWTLKISVLGGCPFAKIHYRGFAGNQYQNLDTRCLNWVEDVANAIVEDQPDYVFTSFYARQEKAEDPFGGSQIEQYEAGLTPYWSAWTERGAQVFVMGDPPLNQEVRQVDCVVLNPQNPAACAVDREMAQPLDPLAAVAAKTGNNRVKYLDFTDYFCDERKCYGVVGGVVVYFDANHLNSEFSRSLAPMIAAEMGLPRN